MGKMILWHIVIGLGVILPIMVLVMLQPGKIVGSICIIITFVSLYYGTTTDWDIYEEEES